MVEDVNYFCESISFAKIGFGLELAEQTDQQMVDLQKSLAPKRPAR